MMSSTSLYTVLGLDSDASDAAIRRAFRQLSLQHHPDRFPPDQRAEAEKRFQEITEAFNILRDPEARDRYDKEMNGGTRAELTDPRELSRRFAAHGAQAFREGKLADAIEHLQAAVDHDKRNARAHYFMGLALDKVPGRQREALRRLERAVQLEPENAVFKAEAARLFLALGMRSRARRFASDALALDPTNSKATAVLDESNPAKEEQSGRLFARLRRKG
jgi:curved DNA-binding protein CbpA